MCLPQHSSKVGGGRYFMRLADAFVRKGSAVTPLARLSWSCMDDPTWKLDEYSLKPLTPPTHHSIDGDMLDHQDYVLAVTGDVFRWMINNAPLETLQRVRS